MSVDRVFSRRLRHRFGSRKVYQQAESALERQHLGQQGLIEGLARQTTSLRHGGDSEGDLVSGAALPGQGQSPLVCDIGLRNIPERVVARSHHP